MQKLTSLMLVGLLVSLPLSASEEESDGMMMNHGSKSPPSMDMMDSNGDGEVTQEEFDAYRDNMIMGEVEEEEESEMHHDKMSAFASFDKNKDGVVTEDELAAHAKYSNPGNGTGTLLDDKQKNSNMSDRSNKSDKGNKGGNRDNGNSGGNKGGKDK